MILADTIRNLIDEGVNVIILLADWHAWVNDKFGRDMEKISIASEYMSEMFRAILGNPKEGEAPGEIQFVRASEVMDSGKYWERVLRCSKNMSLSRVRRTFSIMGRDEDSSDHDLAAFYYPALQAADIFELSVDIAFGGMDQRKAHMYMREVAEKNNWIKPTCIHTPMLSGLKGPGGRMDSFDHKMSKSDPGNAILLDDEPEFIRSKMRKAFLEVGNQNSPVFEIGKKVMACLLKEDHICGGLMNTPVAKNDKACEPDATTWQGCVDKHLKQGRYEPCKTGDKKCDNDKLLTCTNDKYDAGVACPKGTTCMGINGKWDCHKSDG